MGTGGLSAAGCGKGEWPEAARGVRLNVPYCRPTMLRMGCDCVTSGRHSCYITEELVSGPEPQDGAEVEGSAGPRAPEIVTPTSPKRRRDVTRL